jgi:hypothetical protein
MDRREMVSEAKGLLERMVLRRSAEWGRQIQTTGDSLRRIGDELRSLGVQPAADFAQTGADYARRFGSYLETADLEMLLHDAETFARRQPLAVVGAGFVLGLAGARVLKAGSSRRYRRYGEEPTYGGLP